MGVRIADGIQWAMMSEGPVITKGLLDTQNLAFWDGARGEYRAYHRNEFRCATGLKTMGLCGSGKCGDPVRYRRAAGGDEGVARVPSVGDILTALSDLSTWTDAFSQYREGVQRLYTIRCAVYRAPHVPLGFPSDM